MNANQAQAGINRLLQLGEAAAPAARAAPVVGRSVNERSFDHHMQQADARDARDARARHEPSRTRSETRDNQTASGREDAAASARRGSDAEQTRGAQSQSGTDAQHGNATAEPVVKEGNKLLAEARGEPAAEQGAKTAAAKEVKTTAEPVAGLLLETEALTEPAPEALLGEMGEVSKQLSPVLAGLNGGALAVAGQSGQLNTGDQQDTDQLEATLSLHGEVSELVGDPAAVGQLLPVAAGQAADPASAATSSILQSQAGLGAPKQAATPAAGGINAATPAASAEAAALPFPADASLSADAKTAPKLAATDTALNGEQNGLVKQAVTMTPQADKWFKELAAEPKGPEPRPAPVSAAPASAVADMARAQSRIAASMAAPGAMGPLQTQVKTPFGAPQWGGAMAERVAFLASQRVTAAEIHLDPPELGPLQVRVTLNQEQASVSFVAQNAAVREALDQGAFRLREMLDAEGLDLVDVDVSGQSFAEQDSEASGGGEGGAGEQAVEAEEQQEVAPMRLSLVDHFV